MKQDEAAKEETPAESPEDLINGFNKNEVGLPLSACNQILGIDGKYV